MPSIDYAYALTKKDLESISLAEVNETAKTLITKNNQVVVVQAPEKEKIFVTPPALPTAHAQLKL